MMWKLAPWLVLVLAIVGVYAAGSTIVREWRASIFQAGEAAERGRQEAIARRIEATLGAKIDAIDARAADRLTTQAAAEVVFVDRVRTEIRDNPVYAECRVSDALVSDRNAIRASLDLP